MKKIIIVTPFDSYSYNVRVKFVERYFSGSGYSVKVISSDFDHRSKTRYNASRSNLELVHVPRYKKNLSFSRLRSHISFARESVKKVSSEGADLLYVSGPPNSLYRSFAKYKKKHPETGLIFEVGDMWPETFPVGKTLKKILGIPFGMWRGLRDRYLEKADLTIFECSLFREKTLNGKTGTDNRVLYLCKDSAVAGSARRVLPEDEIRLVYLGSVNNIIDIDEITEISYQLSKIKKTTVHIIGDGEQKETLLSGLNEKGVNTVFHGVIFDEAEKKEIYGECHFALNLMKDSVCVGVTMKSIDYFEAGLPVINNIAADSSALISENNCGFNLVRGNEKAAAELICGTDSRGILEMGRNSRMVFDRYFSAASFAEKFDSMIKELFEDISDK